MAIHAQSMLQAPPEQLHTVFLSASIPDPERWEGRFEPLEITDAVSAFARVMFTGGARVVTAAHPTIAPLVLYVAAEFPTVLGDPPVVVYQSRLFEDVLPPATQRFQEENRGRMVWTQAVAGERPEPGHWNESLQVMRRQMLEETRPSAAVFVGGMDGIFTEFEMFRELFPNRPAYAVGRPGGAAQELVDAGPAELQDELEEGSVYPALWRRVLNDLSERGG